VNSGQSETQADGYLNGLAMLPISFLGEQADGLADLCGRTTIGDNYRALFVSSVWVYLLHSYVGLVREHMGDEVAKAVWSQQREMFDKAEAGAARALESAFMLIDGVLDMDGPRGEPEAATQVTPETRIALALLLGMPESLACASSMDQGSRRIGTMQADVESCLAQCLLQARAALLAACSELFVRNHADG
jgi:hypothetical protein